MAWIFTFAKKQQCWGFVNDVYLQSDCPCRFSWEIIPAVSLIKVQNKLSRKEKLAWVSLLNREIQLCTVWIQVSVFCWTKTIRYVTIRYDRLRCVTIQCNMIWYIHYDTLPYVTIRHVTWSYFTLWYATIHCDMIWYIMIRYFTSRYFTSRYDPLRCDATRYDTLYCPHSEICPELKCCTHKCLT